MTRLADVTRPVGPAFFTPIIRPRVLQRIEAAAAGRVVLIVAPAGYGKSLALSQWLENRHEPSLRFDVLPEHGALVGFARGMAQACAPASPSLVKTVATASKSSASAESPGLEMARWMTANLENFNGVIAIDDFQRTDADPEVSRFVSEVIGRTKSHIRWVIATRSTLDLPVASWLGYGDVHFIVGERELVFSEDETHALSQGTGEMLTARALREIMDVTAGWPVALGLALRSPAVLRGGKALANATRDVVFEYLAEQVYQDLRSEERDLLQFACYLPAIQAPLLEVAGYRDWARVLEGIRRRATFLTLQSPGMYKCHDLFHEFLRREIETTDPERARNLQFAAAAALEQLGQIASALRLYTRLGAGEHVLRLLQEHGFTLMDHSDGDAVEAAIGVLPHSVRTSDPAILGLRAQREADLGHFTRAENLFEKALDLSGSEDLRFKLALMLAVLLRNEGRRVCDRLTESLRHDQNKERRLESLALMAVDHAMALEREQALHWMKRAEENYDDAETVEVQSRVLLRLGIARLELGLPQDAVFSALREAATLAESAGMLGMAARAYNVLGIAQFFYLANYPMALVTLVNAIDAARRGGDRFALQSTIVYMVSVESNLGDQDAVERHLHSLREVITSDSQRHRVVLCNAHATLAGWRGDFSQASDLMREVASEGYGYYDFDRAFNISKHLLYRAAAGMGVDSNLRTKLITLLSTGVAEHAYAAEKRSSAVLFLALAECCADNPGRGLRILDRLERLFHGKMANALALVRAVCNAKSAATIPGEQEVLLPLWNLGYGGLARSIKPCLVRITARFSGTAHKAKLTPAERELLILLDKGYQPKEIAYRSGRSVHTIRTLIQRAIQKLDCHNRHEAVAVAKRGRMLVSAGEEAVR